MKMKYVVTNEGDFAIFTNLTNHSDVGYKLSGLPIGAGFIQFDYDSHVNCYGESVSMKLKSRGDEDADIINKKINQ